MIYKISRLKEIVGLAAVLFSTSACAITRSDVLECGLPDGSKFVLTSKYEWHPIAEILPGHPAADRTNQSDYSVRLVTAKPRSRVDFENYASIPYKYPEVTGNDKELCHKLYSINDNYHIYQNFYSKKQKLLSKVLNANLKGLSITKSDNPSIIQSDLDSQSLTPIYEGFYLVNSTVVVFEQALTNTDDNCNSRLSTDEQCKIVAVARSELSKDSQTWTEPIITKDAKVFELGKTIYEQSFIARPISINGKKIEAHFPTPPNMTRNQ